MARSRSTTRPVVVFLLLGTLALVLVAASGLIVVRRLANDQALQEARQLTELSGRAVQQRIGPHFLTGDAASLAGVTSVVHEAVLKEPVVRVKIWAPDGTIVYSDELRLLGDRYELGAEEQEVLQDGGVVAELSDLEAPENRFERSFGQLMEVYSQIQTPDGTPLLFETYQRQSSIAGNGSELVGTFAPVLIVTLFAFVLLEVPLGWALARRVRRTQTERERLMERAIGSSDRERRRIAGDLHDGPVQELAGLSMQLSAAAETIGDASAREALRRSASAIRGSVKTLRSAIVGIYPPNLRQAGLGAALHDLVARLHPLGVDTTLDLADDARLAPEVEELLYRVSQEALRNVEQHAAAGHVLVALRQDGGRAVLEVVDDGRGLPPDRAAGAEGEHMGLGILGEMVRDAGGHLTVRAGDDGRGTVVHVEVPT
jgi:signal transduction histidine kinase